MSRICLRRNFPDLASGLDIRVVDQRDMDEDPAESVAIMPAGPAPRTTRILLFFSCDLNDHFAGADEFARFGSLGGDDAANLGF